jgi:hypothetical protein
MTGLVVLFVGFIVTGVIVSYLYYTGKKRGEKGIISTQNEMAIKKSIEVAKDVQVNHNLTSNELDDKLQQFVSKD